MTSLLLFNDTFRLSLHFYQNNRIGGQKHGIQIMQEGAMLTLLTM